jgi:flagellar basal body P-ring formation protein FlgA
MKPIVFSALLLAAPLALAQQGAHQNLAALPKLAQQYLETQSAGLPGQVKVTVGAIDQRLNLAACPAPEAFQPPGARAWGKTTVGLRCTAPAWSIYVQAQVSVVTDYVTAAVPLVQGQPIEATQLVLLKGDIAAMPNGILTDLSQALGRTPTVSLASGTPLRSDLLKRQPVVQQGQTVRLVSKGVGFSVSSEAKAIGTAAEGQVVQVRTSSGSVVSGKAGPGGVVDVSF